MQALFYSEARNSLRDIINKVCNNFEQFIITTKDKQSAILISQSEYNAMRETIFLLSSKTNRDRLLDSIEQIDNGIFIKKDI